MKWLRQFFSKPEDPGAEYIARLNREAKQRELQTPRASEGLSSLGFSSSYLNAINSLKAYSITADQIQSGTITADTITTGVIGDSGSAG